VNRELIEFLNEFRVALPGVQVLFRSCWRCRSQPLLGVIAVLVFGWLWFALPLIRRRS
jgi:hypothetical protein